MEAECDDGMAVRIRERGEGMNWPAVKTLVHCEGQEVEITAKSWLQLRMRLNDIARIRSGLKGFLVLGKRTGTGFSKGEEIWTYWADGLSHWLNWEREPQNIVQKTVAILIDDNWFMIPKKNLNGAQKYPNTMRAQMAKGLHVPLEELRCVKIDDSVDPMIRRGVLPSSTWQVTLSSTDWQDPVMIQIHVNEEILYRRIMRR
jgi:hypothetical protein